LSFIEDQHLVGDFGPDGEDEPFGIGVRERRTGRIFAAWIPALVRTVSDDAVNCRARSRTRNRKSAARSPRSIAVQEEEEEEAEGVVPLAHVIRDIAGVGSIHAFEGAETIQTRIVGADITGTGACS
jgi:hypothetical protein